MDYIIEFYVSGCCRLTRYLQAFIRIRRLIKLIIIINKLRQLFVRHSVYQSYKFKAELNNFKQYILSPKMEKLSMCRICLVENVRMYVVVNRSLHELYEKLTDIPFVTEDSRPVLACFFCCNKLKQCCRLLRQCLEAEELFAQMMNEDYEPNRLINQDRLEFYGGFVQSPIESICVVDGCQTKSIAIKEELPAVCEGLDDIIEPKEETQSDVTSQQEEPENFDNSSLNVADIPLHYSESDFEYDVPLMEFKIEVEEEEVSKKNQRARETKITSEQEPENFDNSSLNVADIPLHYSESDFEYDVPLLEFKIEVEEEEVSKKNQRAREMKRESVAKKPKLDTRRTKLEDAITAEQTKIEKLPSKVMQTTQKWEIVAKKPKLDTRRTKLEDAITAEQMKIEKLPSKVMQTTQKCTSKPGTYVKEPYKCDQRSFNQVTNMIQHTRTEIGEKPYKCDVCQRSFRSKSVLNKHIRLHTGEKPYKCYDCQRSFSQQSHLKNHIRIHTGEKPYKCYVCQRSFSQHGHLTKHILIHTGEKPYKCDVCQRSFSRNSDLTRHIRIHTGEKPC